MRESRQRDPREPDRAQLRCADKRWYRSQAKARQAIPGARFMAKTKGNRLPTYCYPCPVAGCGGYHLTSYPKNNENGGKR